MQEPAQEKKRNLPGRPEGKSGLRDAIIANAEAVFSENGFSRASLRMIAEKTNVTTALINYYFGSKLALYEEIYMRKAGAIAAARLRALDLLEGRNSNPTTRQIISAFVSPILEMRRTAEGRAFLRFQWSVDTEIKELSYSLRKKAYDESTRAYARALHRANPQLSLEICYARLIGVIGATIYAVSTRHRMEELLPSTDAETGADLILEQIIAVAGRDWSKEAED